MTVYRITADGRRRRLGSGNVRAVDLSGSRWTDVVGTTGMGVGVAAPAGAWANVHGDATLLWSVSAALTTAGLLGHTIIRFGAFGALAAVEHTHGSTALGIRSHGRLVGAQPLVGHALQSLALTGHLVGAYSLGGATRVAVRVAGDLRPFASIRGHASLGVAVSGRLTVAPARHWQEIWRDAYQSRREVLNAIAANNRLLAKSAGNLASANADALVITNVNVGLVDNKVTSEALRTALLTADVGDLSSTVLDNQIAQVAGDDALAARIGTAELELADKASTTSLNSQISRIDQNANNIVLQSNALSSTNAAVAGKASTEAVNTLNSYVRSDVDGRVSANSSAITQVGLKADNTATATQVMRVDVDSVTGKVNSSYTLAMSTNGKFSGVKYGNDGAVSNADFLFDNFNFVTADGAFFIGGGRTINRFGGFMTVSGRPFGVNNEFTEWYGPDVAIEACARENALSFKTRDGIPYFGGILTKEAQARTASSAGFGNGTLACPPHPSNGGRKKINVSLSRSNYGYLPGNVSPATGGIGAPFNTTFDLQRRIGAGAWVSIKTHASNSSVNGEALYESEFRSTFFNASGSGGLTFEDTDATVATVQYQVVYTVSGGPPAYSSSDAGSPINRQSTQSTKITVIEDAPF